MTTCDCQRPVTKYDPAQQQRCQGGYVDAHQVAEATGATIEEVARWTDGKHIESELYQFPGRRLQRLYPLFKAVAAICGMLRRERDGWRNIAQQDPIHRRVDECGNATMVSKADAQAVGDAVALLAQTVRAHRFDGDIVPQIERLTNDIQQKLRAAIPGALDN